ncbi:Mannan endo-1 [Escovopsis weberi]|uniref:Mannan endo-1,6-alpha-mannosidase n=1 Tax=Escovopsis weberi TaxID=150374 RepID=A0A0M8N4B3_ESCWE|nr:Mannan endo-1 [Escovopsis weberi]
MATIDLDINDDNPYYWWEAGALFGTMVDYWLLTGDTSYVASTLQALSHQAGPNGDYLPSNQSLTEGNDDQGFWALAALSAAENVFPNPPDDQPQWLAMAQSVFNQYVSRWQTKACGGGLVWQIFSWNKGNDYKNSVANGCFFDLAARLHRYTGNSSYGDWAKKIVLWEESAGLISNSSQVFDGVSFDLTTFACGKVDKTQWSYNSALFMHGSATMYNITGDDFWKTRLDGFYKDVTTTFVFDGVPYEQWCETRNFCDLDQVSFKGFLLRWLAGTAQMAPYKADDILKIQQTTAKAAISTCIGPASTGANNYFGIDGTACGFSWLKQGQYDGKVGVGAMMNALDAVMYLLTPKAKVARTAKSGGTSKGNPGANAGDTNTETPHSDIEAKTRPTPAGRFGAGVLTVLLLVCAIGGPVFSIL